MTGATPLLEVRNLRKVFRHRGFGPPPKPAVDDVSFAIAPRETLALVGESGSGKTTTGRLVLRLSEPTAGAVVFEGREITHLSHRQMKPLRRRMQVVFQDPYSALNPRMTVGDFVTEPLAVHGVVPLKRERRERGAELFRAVGLDPRMLDRYPHEFSGGQRQRIGIARAIALEPVFIVADEPITALDVSIQAQIVNLFQDLQAERDLSYLFIAHDLNMVRYLCDRVAVMFAGRIVEIGPTRQVFEDARHPYTRSLLSAIPIPDPDLERQRKRLAFDQSTDRKLPLRPIAGDHFAAV
jgi:peptide/nickel transport system ATP-binding protein